MNNSEKKEKEIVADTIKMNEASVLRWIVTLGVGFLFGSLLSFVSAGIAMIFTTYVPAFKEGGSWNNFSQLIVLISNFVGMFWGLVIAIRIIAKTSIKAFIFGAERTTRLNIKKEVLPVAGLYFLGIILASLLAIKHISLNNLTPAQIVFTFLFSLAFTWMQTSWEEFVFRGIPLRMICHNDIDFNKKAVIGCIISSLMFMAVHITNPEVQSLSGMDAVLMTICYFIPGVLLYVVDIICGNLLPGLIIHFVNNFFAFVIISASVSAGGATTIWIDHSEQSGAMSILVVTLGYIPVLVYLIIKRRALKSEEAQCVTEKN